MLPMEINMVLGLGGLYCTWGDWEPTPRPGFWCACWSCCWRRPGESGAWSGIPAFCSGFAWRERKLSGPSPCTWLCLPWGLLLAAWSVRPTNGLSLPLGWLMLVYRDSRSRAQPGAQSCPLLKEGSVSTTGPIKLRIYTARILMGWQWIPEHPCSGMAKDGTQTNQSLAWWVQGR